ncbi:hypothetical protein [Microtetraspora glauca]|uniref:Uncharacterized protein n=1 Tax=Microtetraspora glauca TaxID=1996 RepID=A0ABV3GNS2_MICGL
MYKLIASAPAQGDRGERNIRQDGDLLAIHSDLREQVRQTEGREAESSAGIGDSQSLRVAETVGADSRG